MRKWLRDLDRILRGEATHLTALREGSIDIKAVGITVLIILLGMFYGACMGCYAVLAHKAGTYKQVLASMVKVPALFLLTLLVTLPSLYVFNALLGSRLTPKSMFHLLIAAIGVMLALLASFGTIVAFFSFTTDSYHFMVLLNVVVFAVAGALGLRFLLQTLNRISAVQEAPFATTALPPLPPPIPSLISEESAIATEEQFPPAAPAAPAAVPLGALEPLRGRPTRSNVKAMFQIWVIVFGMVGAQMSWILRPFIGGGNDFAWFRPRGSNFFQAVYLHIHHLFGM